MAAPAWTEADLAVLRAEWATVPVAQLAARLGRSACAIRTKASNLKLHRPHPAQRARQARNHRDTPEGPERLCSRCKEWWPEDAEFFMRSGAHGWQSWCRACYSEQRAGLPPGGKVPVAAAAAVGGGV